MPPDLVTWLELPLSRTNFHGPKGVRAIEFRLYMYIDRLTGALGKPNEQPFPRQMAS